MPLQSSLKSLKDFVKGEKECIFLRIYQIREIKVKKKRNTRCQLGYGKGKKRQYTHPELLGIQINTKLSRSKFGNTYQKTFKMCLLFGLNISLADVYLKGIIEHVCKKLYARMSHCSILFNTKEFEANNQGASKTFLYTSPNDFIQH